MARATGCTINTVACTRMSVSAARPVHTARPRTRRGFLTVGPTPPTPSAATRVATVVASSRGSSCSCAALAFFMLQPGCSNNAQANEACIRQLHLANWHAPTDSTEPPTPCPAICATIFQLCVVICSTNEKRQGRSAGKGEVQCQQR